MERKQNSESPSGPPSPAPPAGQATGSGLFYRDGREIPPTHPDHGPMHLIPRQEDGSIAAHYYCSKAELYDAEVRGPPPRRQRRDGFTPDRQELFLDALRGGASGREAARLVGISPTTAYNLYNSRDGGAFRAAWDEAARVCDIVLDDTAFDRAVNGQEEAVYHKGEWVGTRRKYDNKLLMQLLRARMPLKYAPLSEIEGWLRHRGIAPPADVDSALDRLRAAEAEWGRRLPGEEEAPRIADEGATARHALSSPVRAEPVEAPSSSPGQDGDGPSTGSGRTEAGVEKGSDASTSPGSGQPEPAVDASTSSTSPDNGQPEPAVDASTSSTSPENGQPGDCDDASMSSTSFGNRREALPPGAEPTAPAPEEVPLIYYRPPPRPRLTQL